jgi:hypothetical protein
MDTFAPPFEPFKKRQEVPPHQTSIVIRVLWTQPTHQGLGKQGTHYKKDSTIQMKIKSSCLFLLNEKTYSFYFYNMLKV